MAVLIPLTNDGDRLIQVPLNGRLMTLRFYWLRLPGAWYLDVGLATGETLARGLKLVPIINLFESSAELTRVYGQPRLVPLNTSDAPGSDDLSVQWQLWWFSPGEFERDYGVLTSANAVLPFDVRALYG